ncbi:prepilin-type N-terminal cleavage/methylation domain-containing protein [Undibacterium sp. Jales W-56]|uniref:type II secretion system protein n=1 Tax=Undibacterium sp. Jales W-56 TaxID=2897325 RepID=UPI0021CE28A6|nr:prepilin-type N-terminal cleavage/methylation domain-containing protein [Undibacterium sp. Jales W-56]MCU6434931.1 prepilin-type N-terminal cleavage/methylation domain-containing protein [Undibacterium sp. Jales W-56]
MNQRIAFKCKLSTPNKAPGMHQTGLTLIELLVSLVILGFVVTIMSGAFFQVAQVVRIAENVNGQFQPQWIRLHSLKDLVGNLVVLENVEKPFQGDAMGFEAYSLSLPQSDWGTVQQFKVKLETKNQGKTELLVTAGDAKPFVAGSWDMPIQFEYLMVDGSTESIWPPMGTVVDVMPRGVVIRASSGERLVQMIAVYDGVRKVEPNTKSDMGKLFGVDVK